MDDERSGWQGIFCIWMARMMMFWGSVVVPLAFLIGLSGDTDGWLGVMCTLALGLGALAGLAFSVRRWSTPPGWAALLARCDPDDYPGR